MKVYRIPLPPDIDDHTIMGGDPQYGMFQGLPSNDPVKVMVRVYIVKVSSCYVICEQDLRNSHDQILLVFKVYVMIRGS